MVGIQKDHTSRWLQGSSCVPVAGKLFGSKHLTISEPLLDGTHHCASHLLVALIALDLRLSDLVHARVGAQCFSCNLNHHLAG